MNPVLFIVIFALLLLGFTCLVHPIIVVKILYLWPKFIFPKVFRDKKILSKLEKSLDLLYNYPEYYETQFENQILILRLTGVISILMGLLSVCMVFSKGG
jgi:hypothetical protein